MKQLYSFLIFLLCVTITNGQYRNVVPGELIVQLEEGHSINLDFLENGRAITDEGYRLISPPLNIYLVKFDQSFSYESFSRKVQETNAVKHIMPNVFTTKRSIPNDKHYEKQEDLRKIDLERAWSVTTGGETILGDRIVVAILDSGYGLQIEDLAQNHHQNNNEAIGDANGDGCPGDCGVDDDMDGMIDEDGRGRAPSHPLYNTNFAADDDENGYIDDIGGLNIANFTDQHTEDNHGTAVAGIVGAKGNNGIGVTGVNWDVDLMLISEVVNVAQIVESYTYIYNQRRLYNMSNGEKGAYVVVTNFSSGIDNVWGSDFPIWCELYDLLGSVGVLSVGATTNSSRNVDVEGDMPTTCESPYLISVTNLDLNDQLDRGGFGSTHIDLGAPGNGTITTSLTGLDNIGDFSGTSSATPHVAGAIALIHSIPCDNFARYFKENPSKVIEIKDYLLSSTDRVSDLVGKSVSEGRLNVFNMMLALTEFCPGSAGGDLEILKVTPNPSSTELPIIAYDGPEGETSYEFLIFDMIGRLHFKESFSPPLYGEKFYTVKRPPVEAGVYLFVIKSETDVVVHRQFITLY